jgi:hypothetical protein
MTVTIELHPQGNLANRMIQLLAAKSLSKMLPDARIVSTRLPEWNIEYEHVDLRQNEKIIKTSLGQVININGLMKEAYAHPQLRIIFQSHAQRIEYMPPIDQCRRDFVADESVGAEWGEDYIVCPIRGAEILDGHHPNYVLIPIEFYREIFEKTRLKPVFMGQLANNHYCNALRSCFPDAIFSESYGTISDFETIRKSKNVVVSVSTFVWLAAWLSNANRIIMPVSGFYHPMQASTAALLPYNDDRYEFYLFPINYAVSVDRLNLAHKAIESLWRKMPTEMLQELMHRAPRWPQKIENYLRKFDHEFYLQKYPDIAKAVEHGVFCSAHHHYEKHGFKENRSAFPLDRVFYSQNYSLAALEVGQGDFLNLEHHYIEVGEKRGYMPINKYSSVPS